MMLKHDDRSEERRVCIAIIVTSCATMSCSSCASLVRSSLRMRTCSSRSFSISLVACSARDLKALNARLDAAAHNVKMGTATMPCRRSGFVIATSGPEISTKPANTNAGIRGSVKVVNPTLNIVGSKAAYTRSIGAPSEARTVTAAIPVTAATCGLASSASSGKKGKTSSNHPEEVDKLTSPRRMSLATRTTTTTSRSS